MKKEKEKPIAQVSFLAFEAAGACYEHIILRIAIVSVIDTLITALALIWVAGKIKR